jgi:hypothetical protein
MLETPKALSTYYYKGKNLKDFQVDLNIYLSFRRKDITMDNQQETNDIKMLFLFEMIFF